MPFSLPYHQQLQHSLIIPFCPLHWLRDDFAIVLQLNLPLSERNIESVSYCKWFCYYIRLPLLFFRIHRLWNPDALPVCLWIAFLQRYLQCLGDS